MGMKLYTKWDGPYRLSRIAKSGVSGNLEDFKTGKVIGRYAFEALKVFVPREGSIGDDCIMKTEVWVPWPEGLGDRPEGRGDNQGVRLGL